MPSDEAQFKAGGIAQTELINAQAAAETSAAKVRELEADLAVDALPAREDQIKAQVNQVAADRASLAEAEWHLKQKQIVSPRNGLVFDTLYRQGEWVAAGNPVVEIAAAGEHGDSIFCAGDGCGRAARGRERARGLRRVRERRCGEDQLCVAAERVHAAGDLQQREPVEAGVHGDCESAGADSATLHPGQPVEVTVQ